MPPWSTRHAATQPSARVSESHPTLFRFQADGMHLSSLISALYERSATFKDLVKRAGGAKTWCASFPRPRLEPPRRAMPLSHRAMPYPRLDHPSPLPPPRRRRLSSHPDVFVVEFDCAPGHESVALRRHAKEEEHASEEQASVLALKECDANQAGSGALKVPAAGQGARRADDCQAHGAAAGHGSSVAAPGDAGVHLHSNGNEEEDAGDGDDLPARWVPRARSGRSAADTADDVAAAALLGFSSEETISDPVLVEKKIRALQKKMRRVQGIEEQAESGSALDHGQQMLLSSKPRLQSSLSHLLQQWATLEPILLEQQEQRLLSIADSECAVCLEEYSSTSPAIRTSCCGYHFHRRCLQQCLDSKGHCPICSTTKASCKVVEQRRQTTGPAAATAP